MNFTLIGISCIAMLVAMAITFGIKFMICIVYGVYLASIQHPDISSKAAKVQEIYDSFKCKVLTYVTQLFIWAQLMAPVIHQL